MMFSRMADDRCCVASTISSYYWYKLVETDKPTTTTMTTTTTERGSARTTRKQGGWRITKCQRDGGSHGREKRTGGGSGRASSSNENKNEEMKNGESASALHRASDVFSLQRRLVKIAAMLAIMMIVWRCGDGDGGAGSN